MKTFGELDDGPFWVQVGLLALITLIFGLPFYVGIPLAYGLTFLTRGLGGKIATGMIGGLFSTGDIPHQHEFSRQDSLIARGKFDEAVESFELHLMEFPEDIPGR